MKKRRIIALTLAVVMLAAFCPTVSAQSRITVLINGNPVDLSGREPFIQEGRVFCPVRAISEYTGAWVSWNGEKKIVTIYRDGVYVRMAIGSLEYAYGPADGLRLAEEPMEAPPQMVGGHTMVPISYVIRALGGEVSWDGAARTVSITIQTEKRGNAGGNHAAGSPVAFSGDSLYYSDGKDGKLYRMDPDVSLTSRLRLSSEPETGNINVLDGYVYYTAGGGLRIMRTRTDGEGTECLLSQSNGVRIRNLQLVGAWLYYALDDGSGIYRLPGAGGSAEPVVERDIAAGSAYCVSYERIYFTDAAQESMCVSAVDGSRVGTIGYDDAAYTNVLGGWIYYIDNAGGNAATYGGTIAKVRVGGGEKQYLTTLPKAHMLAVTEQGMYFLTEGSKALYRAKTDGSESVRMLDTFDVPYLRLTGELAVNGAWLYLCAKNLQTQEMELYRMQTDAQGTAGLQKIG